MIAAPATPWSDDMKNHLCVLCFAAASLAVPVEAGLIVDQKYSAQPTFAVDFQQATPEHLFQSFTPTLSSLNFVEFRFQDEPLNGTGATLYVNVRSGSSRGTVLGTSSIVEVPDGYTLHTTIFGGSPVRFTFGTPVHLTPGLMYYLEPVNVNRSRFYIYGTGGGSTYEGGHYAFPGSTADLWFREGVDTSLLTSVPEPSTLLMAGTGTICVVGTLIHRRRRK
jgi:hypothetical protein